MPFRRRPPAWTRRTAMTATGTATGKSPRASRAAGHRAHPGLHRVAHPGAQGDPPGGDRQRHRHGRRRSPTTPPPRSRRTCPRRARYSTARSTSSRRPSPRRDRSRRGLGDGLVPGLPPGGGPGAVEAEEGVGRSVPYTRSMRASPMSAYSPRAANWSTLHSAASSPNRPAGLPCRSGVHRLASQVRAAASMSSVQGSAPWSVICSHKLTVASANASTAAGRAVA